MLGRVAQSVGGALPGGLPVNPLVGQVLVQRQTGQDTADVTVPDGALFVFAEALGAGGATGAANGGQSGGGAGNDVILSVSSGQILTCSIAVSVNGAGPTTISTGGSTILSANSVSTLTGSGLGLGASGKYPGGNATSGQPGGGGGRLSPALPFAGSTANVSAGCGRTSTNVGAWAAGSGLVCLTFFRSYDAALAFANSLYNGAWQP